PPRGSKVRLNFLPYHPIFFQLVPQSNTLKSPRPGRDILNLISVTGLQSHSPDSRRPSNRQLGVAFNDGLFENRTFAFAPQLRGMHDAIAQSSAVFRRGPLYGTRYA